MKRADHWAFLQTSPDPEQRCRIDNGSELLGRNSKRDNVTRLRAILAGHGRDRLPARATRSRQVQRRLDDQERTQLLAAFNEAAELDFLQAGNRSEQAETPPSEG